jgi:hypothetical protein
MHGEGMPSSQSEELADNSRWASLPFNNTHNQEVNQIRECCAILNSPEPEATRGLAIDVIDIEIKMRGPKEEHHPETKPVSKESSDRAEARRNVRDIICEQEAK